MVFRTRICLHRPRLWKQQPAKTFFFLPTVRRSLLNLEGSPATIPASFHPQSSFTTGKTGLNKQKKENKGALRREIALQIKTQRIPEVFDA